MNEDEIKTMLNVEVINQIKDHTTRNILRNIIFNDENTINWKEVYSIVMKFMPELKLYPIYNMKKTKVQLNRCFKAGKSAWHQKKNYNIIIHNGRRHTKWKNVLHS